MYGDSLQSHRAIYHHVAMEARWSLLPARGECDLRATVSICVSAELVMLGMTSSEREYKISSPLRNWTPPVALDSDDTVEEII
jgi:hypothetical protein